ncbi:MAG: ice-binding family protein [bacterium]|nr:ice-binding family protein [bacterium]
MKKFLKSKMFFLVFALIFSIVGIQAYISYAATSPNTGTASTFGILSSTYTNTTAGTTINGDVGYTTGPAVAPTVNGTTHVADTTYSQAGTAQASTLNALNSQPCTFTATGPIDLATDTTHGPIGVYTPGVYCVTGAATVGTSGISLSGSGTFIFRMTGALDTVANSSVSLASGAQACDVWWTPGGATTLGANSTFVGTNIDAAGITIGNLVNWIGRALAFGGTISTSANTITVPTCASVIVVVPPPTPTPVVLSTPTPVVVVPLVTPVVTAPVVVTTTPVVPLLPNTGYPPDNTFRNIVVATFGIITSLFLIYRFSKKGTI